MIRLLKDKIPIARAQMRLKLVSEPKYSERIKDKTQEFVNQIEKEELDEQHFEMVNKKQTN